MDLNRTDDDISPVASTPPGWVEEMFRPAVFEILSDVNAIGVYYFFVDSPEESEFLINNVENALSEATGTEPDGFCLAKIPLSKYDPVFSWKNIFRELRKNGTITYQKEKRRVFLVEEGFRLPPWFLEENLCDIHAIASARNTCFVFGFSRKSCEEACFRQEPLHERLLIQIDPFDPSSEAGTEFIIGEIRKVVSYDPEKLNERDRETLTHVIRLIREEPHMVRDEISFWLGQYSPDSLTGLLEDIESRPFRNHPWSGFTFHPSRAELRQKFSAVRETTERLGRRFTEVFPGQSLFEQWDWADKRNPFDAEEPENWLEAVVAQLYCSYHDAGKAEFEMLAKYKIDAEGQIVNCKLDDCLILIAAYRNMLLHAIPNSANRKDCENWFSSRKIDLPVQGERSRELVCLIIDEWSKTLSMIEEVVEYLDNNRDSLPYSNIAESCNKIEQKQLISACEDFVNKHNNHCHYRLSGISSSRFARENIESVRSIDREEQGNLPLTDIIRKIMDGLYRKRCPSLLAEEQCKCEKKTKC